MNRGRFGELEVLARAPQTAAHPVPLLFVHGAYTAAWCWDEHFLPWFARAGYSSYAVSLSGHGNSRQRDSLDSYSINDYVDDLSQVISAMPAPPVLIGHSMGGIVVQKYLERAAVPGAVLMASVPPQGLWASAMGVMFSKPGLMQDLNHLLGGGQPSVSSVREALFHQEVEQEKLVRFSRLSQPESHRAIWDMTMFNLPNVALVSAVPMLVLGAEYDQLIPPALVTLTGRTYGVREEIFDDMGHAMMLEKDWRRVAERIRDWIAAEIG